MSRVRIRKAVNIFILAAVIVSWLMMALFGHGTLSENGLGNLRYFTLQSNILEGIASAVWLAGVRRDGGAGDMTERFKYIAAASVGLTFVTVMGFLGPLYGYPAMFTGANLFFHLIVPVASMAEIILLSDMDYSRRDNFLCMIPPLVYGAVYLANIGINGIGEWPETNDWYLFLSWGYPTGILIFAIICLVTLLIGLMMRKLNRAGH